MRPGDWLLLALAIGFTLDAVVAVARLVMQRRLRKARQAAERAFQPRSFTVDGVMSFLPPPGRGGESGGRPRPFTARTCVGLPGRPCGAIVAGGPTRCGYCAHTAGEWAKG